MSARERDVRGFPVDCRASDVVVLAATCPLCGFEASAAAQDTLDAAAQMHHDAVHLPNAEYLAHTQRHP